MDVKKFADRTEDDAFLGSGDELGDQHCGYEGHDEIA